MFENHQRNTNPPSRKGGNDSRRAGGRDTMEYIYYNAGGPTGDTNYVLYITVQCWLKSDD